MFCVNDDVNDNVELMVKIMSKSYQITTPHSLSRLKAHSHAVDLVLHMITSDKPSHRSLVIIRRHWSGIWRIRRRRRCVLISGLILMSVPKLLLFVVNKHVSFHHLLLKMSSSLPVCFYNQSYRFLTSIPQFGQDGRLFPENPDLWNSKFQKEAMF